MYERNFKGEKMPLNEEDLALLSTFSDEKVKAITKS